MPTEPVPDHAPGTDRDPSSDHNAGPEAEIVPDHDGCYLEALL